MELRHLRYFVAVAENENVTRAAAKLHVSQPAVSRQMRDLEEELNVLLFCRSAQSLRLTPAGAVFLNEARAVLQRVQDAIASARNAVDHPPEVLQVGYSPSPTAGILAPTLRIFRESHPAVNVVLHDMTSSEMLSGLLEGSLNAALLVRPDFRPTKGIQFEILAEYPVGLLVPKGHRLARRKTVKVTDLKNESLVRLSRTEYPDYNRWCRRVLGPSTTRLRTSVECDGAMSLITAVEAGRGVAVISESIVGISGRRAHYVPLDPAPEPIAVGIVYRKARMSPALRDFVATTHRISTQLAETHG